MIEKKILTIKECADIANDIIKKLGDMGLTCAEIITIAEHIKNIYCFVLEQYIEQYK